MVIYGVLVSCIVDYTLQLGANHPNPYEKCGLSFGFLYDTVICFGDLEGIDMQRGLYI